MRAVGVLHEDEVPVELRVAGDIADGVELILRVLAGLHGGGDGVVELHEVLADLGGFGDDVLLQRGDLGDEIVMALGAGVVDELLILQRAGEEVVHVLVAIRVNRLGHVAVGAGELAAVDAALAEIGLELGVLHLDDADAGVRAGEVREALTVFIDEHVVVVIEDRVGVHGGEAVVRQGGRLRVGREVVLHVALAAGEVGGVDLGEVLADRVRRVGVGDDDLAGIVAGLVGVAVVAAEGLVDLLHDVLKLEGIGGVAHVVRHDGEVRGLAGEAVCQRMRAGRAGHVVVDVHVAAGALILLGKAIAVIERDEIGELFEIAVELAVVLVGEPGLVLVRIELRPVLAADLLDLAVSGLDVGDLLRHVLQLHGAEIEGLGVNPGLAQSTHNGVSQRFGRDGRAADGVHVQILAVDDRLRKLGQRLGADAVRLLLREDAQLIDLILIRHDLDRDRAVASVRRALHGHGGFRHGAVAHADGVHRVRPDDIEYEDRQQQNTAAGADNIADAFFLLRISSH